MNDLAVFGRSVDISSLSANQQKALAALLTRTTIEGAAEQCGLAARTIRGYLAQQHFSHVYREQRALILQEVVAGLTKLGTDAVAKLESALEAGDINTELRAATRVLDYIVKLVEPERRIRETQELEARITDLEIATEAASKGSGANGRRW